MANILNGHLKSKIQNFSVETVRNLLNTDNKGIAKLCAQVSMMPKKDQNGRTYFSKDDLEILRRVKTLNEQTKIKPVKRNSQKAYATVPVKSVNPIAQPPENKPVKLKAPAVQQTGSAAVEKICSSLTSLEHSLTDKFEELLEKKLDEKLDGMDEVVVELVRCKTENETLRYKMNELNKEVYNLKNELSRYKSLGLGLYVKKSGDSALL